jgi:hypothetical protein
MTKRWQRNDPTGSGLNFGWFPPNDNEDAMRRRTKDLITDAKARAGRPKMVPVPQRQIEYTRELELAIKADVMAGRTMSFENGAQKLGCSREKMRLMAQGYPLVTAGRGHRMPECVFKLIVRDRAVSVA